MINMKNVTHVVAYKDPAHATNQASILNSQSGDILMTFNEERGPDHKGDGQPCLIRSHDGGKTWNPATKLTIWPSTDVMGNWPPGPILSQRSNGELILTMRQVVFHKEAIRGFRADQNYGGDWEGKALDPHFKILMEQKGIYILKSKDDGHTWSNPLPINTSPLGGGECADSILELSDGSLLMPLTDSGAVTRWAMYGVAPRHVALFKSDTGGNSWKYWATVAYDGGGIIEWRSPGITRLKDGKLICLLKTTHRPTRQGNLWFTYSKNEGRTWSPPEWTNLWGYPADVIQLQDGRILAVYGYRKAPWGVRGCVSEDGLTWDIKNEFIVRKGGAAPIPSLVAGTRPGAYWHIGDPTCCQLDNGTILVGYHEYSKDTTPVQHLRCTRFTLDE
jgi:hypothetical protein